MNFIEAVQALQDGQCESIRHPDWAESSPSLGMFDEQLVWESGAAFTGLVSQQFLSTDWQIINPTPQTETVEVKRWFCVECCCTQGYKDSNACCNKPLVELTGTYQREVKPKVKRREEAGRVIWWNGKRLPTNTILEWEEQP